MRRLAALPLLALLALAACFAIDGALRALLLPRLEQRLGAAVTVERLRPAWPPALALREVRTRGASPLERADEIRIGIDGILVRGGVIRLTPPRPSAGGAGGAAAASTSGGLPKLRAEDCTVHVESPEGWMIARGVSARPTGTGWRVTARDLRVGRGAISLRAGPAAADVTSRRSWHRMVATGVTVEAHGLNIGPLVIRARDGWNPAGPEFEIVMPRDETRIAGERLSASVAGSITVRLPPGGGAMVRAQATLRDAKMLHGALASRPVTASVLEIAADLTVADAEIAVDRLALKTGALAVTGSGRWRPQRIDATAELAPTDCAAALRSLPDGLAPTLADMPLSGSVHARAQVRFEASRPEDTVVDFSFPLTCRALGDPPAASMTAVGHGAAPLRSYGRYVPGAFQVAEDLRFWDHEGFDAEQIRRAVAHDLSQQSFSRGASTISQQVVKNLFLSHERTLSRKLQEAVLTWRMEQVVPKRRVLEAYLDLVELGPGVRGVEAAARAYFGVAARDLDPLQAVHLAALTPAPVRLSRALAGGVSRAWRTRLDELLDFMRHQRLLSPSDWMRARARRLTLRAAPPQTALTRN